MPFGDRMAFDVKQLCRILIFDYHQRTTNNGTTEECNVRRFITSEAVAGKENLADRN